MLFRAGYPSFQNTPEDNCAIRCTPDLSRFLLTVCDYPFFKREKRHRFSRWKSVAVYFYVPIFSLTIAKTREFEPCQFGKAGQMHLWNGTSEFLPIDDEKPWYNQGFSGLHLYCQDYMVGVMWLEHTASWSRNAVEEEKAWFRVRWVMFGPSFSRFDWCVVHPIHSLISGYGSAYGSETVANQKRPDFLD